MSKELYVRKEDDNRRVSYLIKELLKDGKEISVVSSHIGAHVVARVCNNLTTNNFVNIADVQTKTEVRDGKRKLSFTVKLTKTSQFDQLYEENRQRREERKNEKKETPQA